MKTKLTITITIDADIDRRNINNLLANSHSEIHDRIMNERFEKRYSREKMGARDYGLEVEIEKY